MATKTLIVLHVRPAREFVGLDGKADPARDNREGLWYADAEMERVDLDGAHIEWINPRGHVVSGLRPAKQLAESELYDRVRLAVHAIRLAGPDAYMVDHTRECPYGSDITLEWYLKGRKAAAERKVQLAELRRQVAALLLAEV